MRPCFGNALSANRQPRYAAAHVDVFRGSVRVTSTGTIFPTGAPVTSADVAVNQQYTFSLPAGDYALVAYFPPPANVRPWVSVVIEEGETAHVDIPNMCM